MDMSIKQLLTELFTLEHLQQIEPSLLLIILLLFFPGLILLALGCRRHFTGRFVSGSIQGLSGLSCVAIALLLFSIGMNLYSYQRLTYEQDIAEIQFTKAGQQAYQAVINYADGKLADQFLLFGDEWQLDARMIKWKSWANLLGLNSHFRLERISGRYTDIDDELSKPRSVYSLAEEKAIDYWKLVRSYQDFTPWIDAYYGSATYLPMADGARYIVSITQTGLIARIIENKKPQ